MKSIKRASRARHVIGLALVLSLPATPVLALDQATVAKLLDNFPSSAEVGKLVDDVKDDMPIGTPSAAVMLGISTAQVPRVTTFRDAAVTLSNGLGKDGKITQAIGAEFLPATALRKLQWRELNSFGMRAWARTSVSFATLPSEKTGSARTALGLQTVLYSREAEAAVAAIGDRECTEIRRGFEKAPDTPTGPGQPLPTFTDADQAALDACVQLINKKLNRWNPTTLAVGAGQAYFSADGAVKGLSQSATSYWITGAWGMDFNNMPAVSDQMLGLGLTGHWRHVADERTPDPANAANFLAESARLWALNLRLGTPRLALLAEQSRRQAKLAGYADEDRRRSFVGAELRVMTGVYVAVGVAGDQGGRDGRSQRLALANLKWGFGDKPVFAGR